MFTLYRIAFALAQEPYRIGVLFTKNNDDFGAISDRARFCCADLLSGESYRMGVHTVADSLFCVRVT